ncbi:AraC family transcriptional regulator [Coprothermobacteraceae bacterium]|nr:AraC family transcriptional regulator [Coprothermobacteraceae bacterium]
MEPKFVVKEETKVIGMEVLRTEDEKPEDRVITRLWEKFTARLPEIKNKKAHWAALGICRETEGSGLCVYMAGAEVDSFDFVPEGMVTMVLPKAKYAVFTHEGPLEKIGETYDYIYREWLPKSGYRQVAPGFELYDERFSKPGDPFDIYVPVEVLT